MKTRTSNRNHKVVFVQGNIFDPKLQEAIHPDILGPFVHMGYTEQSCTYSDSRQAAPLVPVKPYISRNPILEEEAEKTINDHLDTLIREGARRIGICPPSLASLQALQADRFYMDIIYKWMERHEADIDCLYVIDISTTTNITEEEV